MILNNRVFASGVTTFLVALLASNIHAQLVINELVQTQRANSFAQIPDTGEFIELYNSSGSDLSLDGWTLRIIDLDPPESTGYFPPLDIPLSGTVLASDPYFVIANASNGGSIDPSLIDFDSGQSDFLVDDNNLYEIRNPLGELVDALGVQLTFDPQYANVTTEQRAQIGGGGWGQLITTVETPQSYGRWIDGRDTNKNGGDFGLIPQTPGTSNNLPNVGDYVLPDVDALALAPGSTVPDFSYSWIGPKVVDPTTTGPFQEHAIPASPQGGNAITAWDPAAGGNLIASNSLAHSFDIYAYLDTVNTGQTGVESTTYGVAGTTDALFQTPDPTGELVTSFNETANGNTGVGWVFIKQDALNFKKLFLIDFNDGGDSKPLDPENPTETAGDWTVLETIDLAGQPSDWHRLAIDYDPATGEVIARFNDQTFPHNITPDMVGTFYVGYRVPTVNINTSPPIFDFFVEDDTVDGDFDNDGDVDGRDFLVWQRGNSPNPLSTEDLNLWQANYGGGGLAAATSIPEPNTVFMCVLLGGLFSAVRRRMV